MSEITQPSWHEYMKRHGSEEYAVAEEAEASDNTAYRMTAAAKILWPLLTEKPDLRAENPDFLHALNAEFNAREERIAALTQERDAAVEAQASAEAATKEAQRLMSESNLALSEALALARQAVEVLKPFNTEIHESITNNSLLVYLQFAAGGVLSKVTVGQLRRARAFLDRPEVKAMGGGK